MIEVFQGDNFTLEFEMTDGFFPNNGKWFCQIVDNKPEQTPPIELWESISGTNINKITVDLSAGERTPSRDYVPYKWYIRFTLLDANNKQTTVLQEELNIKEIYH